MGREGGWELLGEEERSCLGREGRRGGDQRPEATFAIYCTPNGTKGAPSQERGKIEQMYFFFKSFLSSQRQVDIFTVDINGT